MTEDPQGWHLQIYQREYVLWGYGPGAGNQIDPAEVVLGEGVDAVRLPFELPKAADWNKDNPPQEYRRAVMWGWRLRSNSMIHDSGWHLTETREGCLTEAEEWIERFSPRKSSAERLRTALTDVREYSGGLW